MVELQAPQLGPMASVKKRLPGRSFSTRYTTKPPARMPEFEMIKPSNMTAAVIVAVTETRPSASEFPTPDQEATGAPEDTHKPRPRRPTLTIPAKAHISEQQRNEIPAILPPPPPRSQSLNYRAPSPAELPLPNSGTDVPTLNRSDSRASTAVEQTPVMRSMFPSYNPSVPLDHQDYYPNMDVAPIYTGTSEAARSPPRVSQLRSSGSNWALALPTQDTAPKESPLRRSESIKRPIAFSESEELTELWSIANGQATGDAADTYTLELSCEDLSLNSEIITFSTASSAPIYALSVSSNNNITITRIHPQDHRTKISICASTLSRPTHQDPLISCMFPKLAGLMALDKSSSAAVAQKLDRQASNVLQEEAIAQAQEREASLLLWDSDSGKFCIMHPTLLDNAATTMRIEITPTPVNPEKITIFAPETETPVLTLSMQNLALTLHTPAISALPSLYILDSLMTALLTLLLHLHRECVDPGNRNPQQPHDNSEEGTPYFPPPPQSLRSNASKRDLKRQRTQSRLSTFRSPRSMKSTRSLVSTYGAGDKDRDIELGYLDSGTGHAVDEDGEGGGSSSGAVKKQKQKQKHKPPKSFIDLDDPRLPKGTRAALKFLYWIFEVVYWVLGLVVQILVALVVGVGKFVTRL